MVGLLDLGYGFSRRIIDDLSIYDLMISYDYRYRCRGPLAGVKERLRGSALGSADYEGRTLIRRYDHKTTAGQDVHEETETCVA